MERVDEKLSGIPRSAFVEVLDKGKEKLGYLSTSPGNLTKVASQVLQEKTQIWKDKSLWSILLLLILITRTILLQVHPIALLVQGLAQSNQIKYIHL